MESGNYYMDLGKNSIVAYHHEKEQFYEFKGKDLATQLYNWTTSLPKGSVLIGENAHFSCPRTEKSKAQYFLEDELLRWYNKLEENGIRLLLFAQKDTEKFRRGVLGLDKTDKNDILSMAYAMHKAPESIRKNLKDLQKPKKVFTKSLDEIEGDEIRETLSEEKNLQRAWDYNEFYHCGDSEKSYKDETVEWLIENIEKLHDLLPSDTRRAFGFDEIYGIKEQLLTNPVHRKIKKAQVLGVLLTLMNLDGSVRTRPSTGRYAGWKFVKQRLFLEHPYRPKRGGVVRASLKWDGQRHFIAKESGMAVKGKPKSMSKFTDEDWINFKQQRREFSRHTKVLWQTMRDLLGLRDSQDYSENSEFTIPTRQLELHM